jgi:hypothetical protein
VPNYRALSALSNGVGVKRRDVVGTERGRVAQTTVSQPQPPAAALATTERVANSALCANLINASNHLKTASDGRFRPFPGGFRRHPRGQALGTSLPPSFLPYSSHTLAKDALNRFFCHQGFAVSIDKPQHHRASRKHPVKYVDACTLRCACGREYKDKGIGKRPR